MVLSPRRPPHTISRSGISGSALSIPRLDAAVGSPAVPNVRFDALAGSAKRKQGRGLIASRSGDGVPEHGSRLQPPRSAARPVSWTSDRGSSAEASGCAYRLSNAAERNSNARHRQPSLLAGLLFDGDGNRMTPSHAVKNGTRYRYYVSGSLITRIGPRTPPRCGSRPRRSNSV